MMRTIEAALVIFIITGAFILTSYYLFLPHPRQISPINLRRLAFSTLQVLNYKVGLSEAVFSNPNNSEAWAELQTTLSAILPPNIVYNFSVYQVSRNNGTMTYELIKSLTNSETGLGIGSETVSLLISSTNTTFRVIPEKIGERTGKKITLFILNCRDANGWWITGYTAQSLAEDFYKLLSPYFETTVMINTTTQLGELLNGTLLPIEKIRDAVVINPFGEAVPIPAGYYTSSGVGYDSSSGSYALYCYRLGQKVREYNWTWVSMVGYPLYYVSNTEYFLNSHNTWGIYGMRRVGPAGLNAFLQGLDGRDYVYDGGWITGSPGVVHLSAEALEACSYYGIYPYPYQTSSRALPSWICSSYHLTVAKYIFNTVGSWIPGAVFRHTTSGNFVAIGLTRIPDIRVTAIALLAYFSPRLYKQEFTAEGTQRLVVLQLGQVGGT